MQCISFCIAISISKVALYYRTQPAFCTFDFELIDTGVHLGHLIVCRQQGNQIAFQARIDWQQESSVVPKTNYDLRQASEAGLNPLDSDGKR